MTRQQLLGNASSAEITEWRAFFNLRAEEEAREAARRGKRG